MNGRGLDAFWAGRWQCAVEVGLCVLAGTLVVGGMAVLVFWPLG